MRTATSVFVIATTVEDRTVCCECVNVRALIDNCFGTECLRIEWHTTYTKTINTNTHKQCQKRDEIDGRKKVLVKICIRSGALYTDKQS